MDNSHEHQEEPSYLHIHDKRLYYKLTLLQHLGTFGPLMAQKSVKDYVINTINLSHKSKSRYLNEMG